MSVLQRQFTPDLVKSAWMTVAGGLLVFIASLPLWLH